MKVLITGGAGFLGRRLAAKLLESGMLKDTDGNQRSIEQVVLVDVTQAAPLADKRASQIVGDISYPDFLASIIDADTD